MRTVVFVMVIKICTKIQKEREKNTHNLLIWILMLYVRCFHPPLIHYPPPFPQENFFCIKLGLFSTISLCRKVVEIKTVNLLLLLLCYRCFFSTNWWWIQEKKGVWQGDVMWPWFFPLVLLSVVDVFFLFSLIGFVKGLIQKYLPYGLWPEEHF